jgi:hypothetical protein
MPTFHIYKTVFRYSEDFTPTPTWICPANTKCFAGAVFWLFCENNYLFLHEHSQNGPDTRVYSHRNEVYLVKRVST